MKYVKPDLVLSGSALAAIQGTGSKPVLLYVDRIPGPNFGQRDNSTVGAYEADE